MHITVEVVLKFNVESKLYWPILFAKERKLYLFLGTLFVTLVDPC